MSFRKTVLAVGLVFAGSFLVAQPVNINEHYVKREVYIPMRDGVRLFTAIYLPRDSSLKYPVMLNRTPYGLAPYGEQNMLARLRPSDAFAAEGYIFVVQDVRGKNKSEGTFIDMTPHKPVKTSKHDVDESTDTYDCIAWLLKHIANHNGRVGLWGISYPGFYTSAGIIDAHPALKAASPQAPISDWFTGDDFHHNGALFLPHFFSFFYGFGQVRKEPGIARWESLKLPTADGYKFYLGLGPLKNVNNYYQHKVPFWDSMTLHETYDNFWQARNIRPHLKKIRPAVLVVGGWFDAENLYGALQTWSAIKSQSPQTNNRIVMGPWVHGGWYRTTGASLGDISFGEGISAYYRDSLELPFFNYHLKGKGTLNIAGATMFETGSNSWKKYAHWPPAGAPITWYLGTTGRLQAKPREGNDEFVSDPAKPVPYMVHSETGMQKEYLVADQRFVSTRPDVLVFEGPILEADETYAGPVTVDLNVATTGTDADWIVKVIDVYPDDAAADSVNGRLVQMAGYQMLVRGDVMRGKFRKSFTTPEPFSPGAVTNVRFALNDINHCFRKGHRVMVQVQSTWFPLVDRNPQQFINVFEAGEKDFLKQAHRVYHNSSVTFNKIQSP
jgi:putative CocE/NonD family hydrolase